MKNKKVTFQESVNEFEDLLQDFDNDKDAQMKGVKLGQLHKQSSVIKALIENEISLIDRRRMQQMYNPKQERLTELEKEFLLEVDLIFYQNQIKDFIDLSKSFYSPRNKGNSMDNIIQRFFAIVNSYEQLKKQQSYKQSLINQQKNVLEIQKKEIYKFQNEFSRELLAYKEQQNKKNNKNKDEMIKSDDNLSEDNEEINNLSSINKFTNQENRNNTLQNQQNNSYKSINIQKSLKGSMLQDLHLSHDNLNEDSEQLQQLKQKMQYDLKQKQQLLREEQDQIEVQNEISQILQDLKIIDNMMNDIAELVQQANEPLDIIEQKTEETLVTLKEAEVELNEASNIQGKYKKKLYSLQGAAVGGGVGFLMGGPIGSAVGTFVGASLGRVAGSIGSKNTA